MQCGGKGSAFSPASGKSTKLLAPSNKTSNWIVNLGPDFKTVRMARSCESSSRQLNQSPQCTEQVCIPPFSSEDERIMHCALDSNLQARTNITTTFDTKNPEMCGLHTSQSLGTEVEGRRAGGAGW